MIPRDGQIPLDDVAGIVSSAPAELGISDPCEVCSVLVLHSDGRWLNHCTILRLGTTPHERPTQDVRASSARLIRREYSAATLVNRLKLLEALTSWQSGDLTG